MKKILYAIPVGLLTLCSSCSDKSSNKMDNGAAAKNLAAAHGVNQAILSGDVSKLGDFIATDAVDHAGMGEGDIKGLDSIKAMLGKMKSMMKDMTQDIVKELADSDYVFQWMHFTGTSTMPDMGMPAGTKYDMTAIEASKYKDGKIIEHWEFMQPSDVMKMMPKGGLPPKMDSSMHK